MSDERPCNRCRKHKYGSCESWECEPELINLTNEQAIEHLTEYLDQAGMDVRLSPEDTAAIAMGIEALKQKYILHADGMIETLPKKGVWVKYGSPRCNEQHYKCTNCDDYVNFGAYGDYYSKDFKYCPHCGAKMEVITNDKGRTIRLS